MALAVACGIAFVATGVLAADAKVKVGSSQTLGEGPFYVAMDKGYFRDEGLDVEMVAVRVGPDALSAVAAGEIDVVNAVPESALFNAFQRRIPLKVVAGAAYTIGAVVARRELVDTGALRTFGNLKGRNLALPSPVTAHHMWVERGAKQAGISISDINLVYLSFPDMMGAFASKRIDAAYLPEPFATNAVEKLGGVRWFDPNPLLPNTVVTMWIYSERIAIQEPELGRKFMVGLLRGTRDFLEAVERKKGWPDAVAAMTKYTQVKDPAMYDRIVFAKVAPNGELRLESLQETLDWLHAKGFVKQPPPLDKIVDFSFAEYATNKLGRYQ
jgi:NitT/TauT family transport system substrate-binding protein